jgi:hypothetical protein
VRPQGSRIVCGRQQGYKIRKFLDLDITSNASVNDMAKTLFHGEGFSLYGVHKFTGS